MTLELAVLVLAGSLVILGVLVALAVVDASKRISRSVAESVSGVFDSGVRPELDYPLFDEALAKLHVELGGDEAALTGELQLEFEPQ